MVDTKEIIRSLKRDVEYIDNTMFGNYKDNTCVCLITFKYIGDESSDWSYQLNQRINYYIANCNARISATCSTGHNIVIKFKVKLS